MTTENWVRYYRIGDSGPLVLVRVTSKPASLRAERLDRETGNWTREPRLLSCYLGDDPGCVEIPEAEALRLVQGVVKSATLKS